MKSMRNVALACVLLGSAFAAGAADWNVFRGYKGEAIEHQQEAQIQAGMTQAEVLQILGQPQRRWHYMHQPGTTWTYMVANGFDTRDEFAVAFGADGKVVGVQENAVEGE